MTTGRASPSATPTTSTILASLELCIRATRALIGSVVYVDHGLYSRTQVPQSLIIDGQQRVTTLMLVLAAHREALSDRESAEVTPRRLTNYDLVTNAAENYRIAS
ncbi:MAG: DUF262 domain-containing protein [Gemmatimonadales bacterium]|nr:DUF262 domain-containing protein [Gemmatimonadales bacterium]